MGVLRDMLDYIRAALRLSFDVWHRGARMGTLVGALIAIPVAVLAVQGLQLEFAFEPSLFWITGLGLWFLILMTVVTPFRMWRSQKAIIEQRRATDEFLLKLGKLREQERTIGRQKLKSAEAVEPWVKALTRKREEIVELIRTISPAEAHTFKHAGELTWDRLPGQLNFRHGKWQAIVARDYARLEQFIEHHARKT